MYFSDEQAGNEDYDGFIQVGELLLAFVGPKRQHTEWYLRKIESFNQNYDINYLYNDKELDTDFGLDWYHYGARMYDPAIARFTGVAPISDQFA